MASGKPELYEGLFLMSQQAGGDLGGSVRFITEILQRAGAEILTVQKWDDRKLAYPVQGQKRGTYILSLFRVGGVQIANIERDCNLSDEVARVLILRGDHMGETEIAEVLKDADKTQAEVKLREAAKAEEAAEAAAAEAPAAEAEEAEASA
jgi:small subunit ribosomal protein S6